MSDRDARIMERLRLDHATLTAELDQVDRRRMMLLAQLHYIGTLLGLGQTTKEARDGGE